ncbi:hypothetical protein FGO68_gene8495 [Halteria grandinella]|uniref:Uncharacterized protein n=1 Tax=Halteria grandinella TaxID=5974 RepID=A0A8J8T7Y4_HALGN|nr:hypothetical protein FGO68_gene8495 [Halteria grandinella]
MALEFEHAKFYEYTNRSIYPEKFTEQVMDAYKYANYKSRQQATLSFRNEQDLYVLMQKINIPFVNLLIFECRRQNIEPEKLQIQAQTRVKSINFNPRGEFKGNILPCLIINAYSQTLQEINMNFLGIGGEDQPATWTLTVQPSSFPNLKALTILNEPIEPYLTFLRTILTSTPNLTSIKLFKNPSYH